MQKSVKYLVWVLLVIDLFGPSVWVLAQEGTTPTTEVQKLQQHFEAELLNLDKPLAMLQDRYRGYLTKLKAEYQADGQLREMLAVEAELQALANGAESVPSNYPELKRLQEIYRNGRAGFQGQSAKIKRELVLSFQKDAHDLAIKLTREGKIEEAKLALAEADRLDAMAKDPALALAVVQPKPASPFGSLKNGKEFNEFTNSLGMKFVRVPGTDVFFCIHETRYRDWVIYYKKNPDTSTVWKNQTHDKFVLPEKGAEDHPVVGVNWEDVNGFCIWLTEEEKKEGRIYRLPTDHEWSMAVGIGRKEDKKATPQEKSRKVADEYPWGSVWPPPKGAGNYSDQSRKAKAPNVNLAYLENYDDGFPTTAPVMSFKPNEFGLYDLGGNVWEWVADLFAPSSPSRVVRGGSWGDFRREDLLSSYRLSLEPTHRDSHLGFRCVVVLAGAGAGGEAR